MKRVNRIIKWTPYVWLCVAACSPAQASVAFQGRATGAFSHALTGTVDYSKIWNHDAGSAYWYASTFEWGTVASRKNCANGQCQNVPLPQTGSSLFAFDGIGSDAGEGGYATGVGRTFSLGTFKYQNMPTYFSEGVTGVDLTIDIGFNALGLSKAFTYRATIDNTANFPADVSDRATLTSMLSPFVFSHDGQAYKFNLLGFSTNGGESYASSFLVDENRFVKANLYGRFDYAASNEVASVPVPAALGLLGYGLLGLLGFGCRAKQRQR